MLKALVNRKAGRNFSAGINWRNSFHASEDSLTASVFERLLYLPTNILGEIICRILNVDISNMSFNEGFKEYEFWPGWDAEGTTNEQRVEPDLFVKFEDFDLVIEAKRNDSVFQNLNQWNNEIIAYRNKYASENKTIVFLAVGGVVNFNTERFSNEEGLIIAHCKWLDILDAVKNILENIDAYELPSSFKIPVINILKDIIEAFGIHHISTGEWFKSFLNNSKQLHMYSFFMVENFLSKHCWFSSFRNEAEIINKFFIKNPFEDAKY